MLDPIPLLDKVLSIVTKQERHMNLEILPNPPTVLDVQAHTPSHAPTPSNVRGKDNLGRDLPQGQLFLHSLQLHESDCGELLYQTPLSFVVQVKESS